MVYQPESNGSVAVGQALQWMAAGSGATYVGGVLAASLLTGAAFPTGNNLGAMAGRLQATYLFGTLSIPQLPDTYRAASGQLSWIALDYRCGAAACIACWPGHALHALAVDVQDGTRMHRSATAGRLLPYHPAPAACPGLAAAAPRRSRRKLCSAC